jgi:pyruvate ferredoxin oxidoreductase gamma subunit
VITVSLYGRGGEGIKTAAHIVGTASFLSGYNVQDQPLYGAERRGAPISAYVRISKKIIMERGQIDNPSLVVVGDDSLLDVASDNPLQNLPESTVVLINTSLSKEELVSKYNIKNSLIVFDLTKSAVDNRTKPNTGVAIASATSRFLELNFDLVRQSIIKELVNIQLSREDIAKSVDLAKTIFETIPHVTLVAPTSTKIREPGIFEPRYHEPEISTCAITATGNSILRERGQWSNYKPIIDYDNCTKCMICYVYCPDSAFTIDSRGYPIVDYEACKGCNICHTECPVKVITLVKRTKK